MADPGDDIGDVAALANIITNAQIARLSFDHKVTQEMGHVAANAAREVAKLQFAVPARNRTYRVAIGAVATVIVCGMAIDKLAGADLGKVLVTAIVALGAIFVVREYKKNKKD